mgnify:CR=1 FL=1
MSFWARAILEVAALAEDEAGNALLLSFVWATRSVEEEELLAAIRKLRENLPKKETMQ